MTLSAVLSEHRVVVCVGSGGVGKTTTAAAIAVHAAQRGQRVLCLTIDPAKRLANSLGLDEMKTEQQVVPPTLFAEHGLEVGGHLSAMMLDTKRTFDDLVERHASSSQIRDRILDNQLYQYMSRSLAGTSEYMAMEKLHAVRRDDAWDLIVLDTPPTANALDFLDAPERLIGLVDSPAMRWFIQAFEGTGKLSLNLVGKSAAMLLKGLGRLTGGEFLAHVAEFVTDLNDLFGGFRERAREVSAALRGPEVAFLLVTSPNPLAIEEALFFHQRLLGADMNVNGIVVNGVYPKPGETRGTTKSLTNDLRQHLSDSGISPEQAMRWVHRLQRALDDEHKRAEADRHQAGRLRERVGNTPFVAVPAMETDVHDLTGLATVGRCLMSPEQE